MAPTTPSKKQAMIQKNYTGTPEGVTMHVQFTNKVTSAGLALVLDVCYVLVCLFCVFLFIASRLFLPALTKLAATEQSLIQSHDIERASSVIYKPSQCVA